MHICLLDIDGTLLLTGGAGQAAFAQTLAAEFGIAEIISSVMFAGRSDRAIAMDLFRAHGVEETTENWQRFCAGYLSHLEAALEARQGLLLPGATELVTALAKRDDVALGLLTGNVREGAKRKLTHYNLWHWFAFGGYGDDHVDRCDIAASALAAAREHINGRANGSARNGKKFEGEIIVIGDTPNDITCGRSIGACCVAVPTGHTKADELRRSNPDLLLDTLEDIGPILSLMDRG
jgi:phosphoglycolate phosphatase-like HAD superfamily hydrolase